MEGGGHRQRGAAFYARARIDNGKLRLSNGAQAIAARFGRPVHATDWTVTARMGNGTNDAYAQLMVGVGGNRRFGGPTKYLIRVGEFFDGSEQVRYNWQVLASDSATIFFSDSRYWYRIGGGYSEAVAPVGELMDVTFSAKNDTLSVVIGDEELFISDVYGAYPNEMFRLWLSVWNTKTSRSERTGVFDWVEVTGSPLPENSNREKPHLNVYGRGPGAATMSVTATDPGGLTAIQPRRDSANAR